MPRTLLTILVLGMVAAPFLALILLPRGKRRKGLRLFGLLSLPAALLQWPLHGWAADLYWQSGVTITLAAPAPGVHRVLIPEAPGSQGILIESEVEASEELRSAMAPRLLSPGGSELPGSGEYAAELLGSRGFHSFGPGFAPFLLEYRCPDPKWIPRIQELRFRVRNGADAARHYQEARAATALLFLVWGALWWLAGTLLTSRPPPLP